MSRVLKTIGEFLTFLSLAYSLFYWFGVLVFFSFPPTDPDTPSSSYAFVHRIFVGGLVLTLLAPVAYGLRRRRPWALRSSLGLAGFLLALYGLWAVTFVSPALLGQVPLTRSYLVSVAPILVHPNVVKTLVGPTLWLIYFTRPSVRAQFRSGK